MTVVKCSQDDIYSQVSEEKSGHFECVNHMRFGSINGYHKDYRCLIEMHRHHSTRNPSSKHPPPSTLPVQISRSGSSSFVFIVGVLLTFLLVTTSALPPVIRIGKTTRQQATQTSRLHSVKNVHCKICRRIEMYFSQSCISPDYFYNCEIFCNVLNGDGLKDKFTDSILSSKFGMLSLFPAMS